LGIVVAFVILVGIPALGYVLIVRSGAFEAASSFAKNSPAVHSEVGNVNRIWFNPIASGITLKPPPRSGGVVLGGGAGLVLSLDGAKGHGKLVVILDSPPESTAWIVTSASLNGKKLNVSLPANYSPRDESARSGFGLRWSGFPSNTVLKIASDFARSSPEISRRIGIVSSVDVDAGRSRSVQTEISGHALVTIHVSGASRNANLLVVEDKAVGIWALTSATLDGIPLMVSATSSYNPSTPMQ